MEYIGKRISILKSPEEVSVVILSEAENKKSTLLLLWLIAWTLCGGIVFWEYFKLTDGDTKLWVVVWLAFWFYFEYTITKAFLWRRSGKEKIKIKPGHITVKREVNRKGKLKSYELDAVSDFRIVEEANSLLRALNNSYWAVAGETLAFNYYGKTIPFGLQLNEAESKELYRLIKHYIKEFNKAL